MLRFVERHLPGDEKGATALFVALCLTLLMGIAAVAIDLGFGFNERRQSQTAADMAVMAGATEIVLGGTQEDVVNQVLAFARANTNITYSDEEWRDLWLSCADPDRIGFDVGTGTPVDFQPMPAPAAWGGGDLDCISSVASYLRVRLPDQVIETTFARVMGFEEIRASAAAVARIDAGEALGSIVPFGLPAGTQAGHICLSTGSHVFPPCAPNVSGSFGTVGSQFYGDYYGNTNVCQNNLNNPATMPQNVALGLDHAVAIWPTADAAQVGVNHGDDFPGQQIVRNYPGIGYDECRVVNGAIVPANAGHVTPANALLMVSGNSVAGWVFDGLLVGGSNAGVGSFEGRLVRSDDPNPTRTLRGSGQLSFQINNRGLWDYLNQTNSVMLNGTPVPECNGSEYGGTILDPADLEAKVTKMHDCLRKYAQAYAGDPNPPVIFREAIGDNPRLVWAPEFWHDEVPSQVFTPIHSFQLVFISGLWLDCSNSCGLVAFPDESTTDQMNLNKNLNTMRNGFEQLSAFLVPIESVPEQARPPIPGEPAAHTATLFR